MCLRTLGPELANGRTRRRTSDSSTIPSEIASQCCGASGGRRRWRDTRQSTRGWCGRLSQRYSSASSLMTCRRRYSPTIRSTATDVSGAFGLEHMAKPGGLGTIRMCCRVGEFHSVIVPSEAQVKSFSGSLACSAPIPSVEHGQVRSSRRTQASWYACLCTGLAAPLAPWLGLARSWTPGGHVQPSANPAWP